MIDESSQIAELQRTLGGSDSVNGVLRTNERVLARVTDGIYRQPGSALRELIANAYDADATCVHVDTNAPKFDRIIIEDDGNGMTPQAVVNLLNNIGGSAKRNRKGVDLGVSSEADEARSPGGRILIGKLGIGMFSVSQLTRSFQIITKRQGDRFRTVVTVKLDQFSEMERGEDDYHSGEYVAWLEETEEEQAHGTTVILNSIRTQTRDMLTDKQFWEALRSAVRDGDGARGSLRIPEFYIGKLDSEDLFVSDDASKTGDQRLPWSADALPTEKFRAMVDAVWDNASRSTSVKLQDFFDAYLRMLWELALSLPIEYVRGSLLDEPAASEWAHTYLLSNDKSGSAKEVKFSRDETPRSALGLRIPSDCESSFEVYFDGIKLYRPIKYRDLPVSQNAIKCPMIFFGKYRQDFDGIDASISCGPLEFSAYLFWNPKIAPTEHQGCLIRIHGASGTLFDSSFFNYQVAELTRLRQVTCEVFVSEGLEAALNIDRESFNVAHPHTVTLTKWLHSALRQFATAQKGLAKKLREEIREERRDASVNAMQEIVASENEYVNEGLSEIPVIMFEDALSSGDVSESGQIIYSLNRSKGAFAPSKRYDRGGVTEKLSAIMQLLSIYGALDNLSPTEQDDLASALLKILQVE